MTYTAGVILMLAIVTCAADAPKLRFKFTTVKVPGAKSTFTTGINNAGVMVGTYEDSAGTYHGYILKDGKVTTLINPGQTAKLKVTFKKAGSYMYICTIPGHEEAGMKGKFKIT